MITATKPRRSLTPRQRAVLAWIAHHIAHHGYAPTIREGQAAFFLRSPNGFACHVRALAARGLVTWDERTPRSLRIADARHELEQESRA